ncbi:MAG: hypothetical protein HOD58_02680 [Gammaproteobacteria bacterium]|jgi:hypothetical protein|nr:hypothetical protein [Gammaproteobacteria bacterium]MBT4132409.1 hypothetical protein [Candidatus Neomarinimicrobiota bacterium]MBT4606481.1 hypothetical protein [Thiotrichales bacterium]MBT4328817.1 hypothetical protein [Gammaproteobacteria bacterium]MBT5746433.1 hypothetical protein [Gammaproteobacteria bacterium]
MSRSIYADGVANITMVDGVVRYDLVTMSPAKEEGKFNVSPVASVSTSVQGMLRTYDQLSKVINKMVEQGVLKKTEPSEPVVEDTAH